MPEPVAIIGSACRLPGGADTPSKLWKLVQNPPELSRKPDPSRFDVDAFVRYRISFLLAHGHSLPFSLLSRHIQDHP